MGLGVGIRCQHGGRLLRPWGTCRLIDAEGLFPAQRTWIGFFAGTGCLAPLYDFEFIRLCSHRTSTSRQLEELRQAGTQEAIDPRIELPLREGCDENATAAA